jgi:transposase-like protein
VVLRMLANAQQKTIRPIVEAAVATGSLVCTDEYDIYVRLEGFWSLLCSWLRPHRGISQEKLPLYLAFFQFVHNARRRGRALLGSLVAALVT